MTETTETYNAEPVAYTDDIITSATNGIMMQIAERFDVAARFIRDLGRDLELIRCGCAPVEPVTMERLKEGDSASATIKQCIGIVHGT